MRIPLVALALLALTACTSTQDGTAPFTGFNVGATAGDTMGTSRRPDVYGGFTRPTTPTFGSR